MHKDTAPQTRDDELISLREEVARLRSQLNCQRSTEDHPDSKSAAARQVLDSVMVAVVQYAKDGSVIDANARARQQISGLGIDPEKLSLYDWRPMTIWPDGKPCHPEDYPATKCLATGEPQGPTTIGVRHGDEVMWATVSVMPVIDPATGKPESVVVTFVDISHPMHVEESLRQSEERYRRLVEDAPDAIVVHREGEIVYINDAGIKMWGGTKREDFLGRNVMDFVHPRYRELVERRVRDTQRGNTTPLSHQRHVRFDGKQVSVEVMGIPCMYDGQPCVQVILRDVTRRRRIERQMRQQREILRKFFDHVPLMVGLFDRNGRIRMVNREWRRVLGFGGELTLAGLVERCFPRAKDRQAVMEFMRTAPPGWRDSRLQLPGGRAYDITAAAIALSNGTRIGIGQDITARKKAESELRRHKAELEQRVAERTDELVHKNQELQAEIAVRRKAELQLQEKQHILERLLDMHERYRQLLAYEIHDAFVQDVIGALMFLDTFYDERCESGDPALERVEQARTLLRQSIGGARRMISGLRPPIIDEQGFIAAVEYLVSELNARGMEIRLDHDVHIGRFAPVLENALFRVVQEALTNAQRHSGSPFAQVNIKQNGNVLRLTVRDYGAGFDADKVGAGHFGLEGIRERARLFGGTVSLTTAPGQGTELMVDIPLPEVDTRPTEPATPGQV